MKPLNLKSRIQRLENRLLLLNRNQADDRLLRRLEAGEERLARYPSTHTYEYSPEGKKAA